MKNNSPASYPVDACGSGGVWYIKHLATLGVAGVKHATAWHEVMSARQNAGEAVEIFCTSGIKAAVVRRFYLCGRGLLLNGDLINIKQHERPNHWLLSILSAGGNRR